IPTDAHVIDADSLLVYAGFIDGFSQVGVKEEKKDTDVQKNKPRNPGNPPDELAGIQPELTVTNLLDPASSSIENLRKIGFTTAHVFPKGKFLAGKGAFVLLGTDSPEKMLLKNETSLCVQFIGAGNVYPSNTLGMMAKFKQLYREATYSKKHEELYAQNPNGIARPEKNKTVETFYPVIERKLPVFFKADKLLDAQKALELQKELGFSLTLAEVRESWLIVDKLKSSKTGVFLSLLLPEEQKETAKKDSTSQKSPNQDEMERLKKRQEESLKTYLSQATVLHKAGIKFGFSTLGAKTEQIRKNFKRMVDAGLSEDVLLAALTTYPAEMLGLSSAMGTLEVGKMANLFLATKPFYDEKCTIKYVFVDGILYEHKDNTKKDPTAKVNLVGRWKYATESPQGKNEGIIVIKGSEGNWN
ncbi:MAG: amidohydrolase family protein, partial [Flammeovirgaceae bacterium]|nr:amidohydrolase family protein [Flammeovirgaceae bacterium]MDW8288767.1 amidohydrolase family protein [Flammeovirgaceae bacterium]